MSYRWFVGPIPKDHFVLHKCDVPGCVRPDHLWTGTQAQNMGDKRAKGRQAFGARHGMAKLSASQVVEILTLRWGGEKLKVIADRYGVSLLHVLDMVKGRRGMWRKDPLVAAAVAAHEKEIA